MKPSASSESILYCSGELVEELKPMPICPRRKGPISTPATRYAVTAGRPTSLASLDSISPASRAMDKVKSTVVVKICAFFQKPVKYYFIII